MILDNDIRSGLKRLAKNQMPTEPLMCTVDSVNTTDLTCYCVPKTGQADITDVKLMALNSIGFTLIPKVGSDVLVAFIDSATAYVAMTSEVSDIRLNGNSFGGLLKLEEWITDINNRITLLKTAINSAFVATDTGIGSAGGTGTSASTWAAQILPDQDFVKSNYENTTVQHGDGT